MSYATPSDIQARYDARRLGDLVGDQGVRVTPSALATDPNLQAALDDASGLIDAALLRGGRYLPADLTGLPAGGNSVKLLRRLCSDLAYGLLLARRDLVAPKRVEDAYGLLTALEEGTLVFADVVASVNSGKPQNVRLSTSVALLSSLDRVFGDQTVDPKNQAMKP